MTSKEIGERINTSKKTVDLIRTHLLKAYQVKTANELMRLSILDGFYTPRTNEEIQAEKDESEKDKIRGTQILVLNALRKQPHLSHFTLDEAVQMADELDVPQTFFTHISHQLGLHDIVSDSLPRGRSLAYDGLVLEF
jgi:phosphoribosyl 1,2-cyclic phosphodiesterase